MNASYSHALRIVICGACGGAMHVDVQGGEHTCEVCDQEQSLAPRHEGAVAPSELGEHERLEALRHAPPSLPAMPPEVAELTDDKGRDLDAELADEAMALWLQTRVEMEEECAEGQRAPLEERFFHLTMLLYRRLLRQRDDLRLRGVLESAVELSAGHRDEQIFRCVLARAAARAGDLTAAEDWIAPCTAHSDDLHADGAYRYTAATIATHKKQHAQVLELLGTRVGELPLARNLDVTCSVLRAHAHEHKGDEEAATLELADCMNRAPGGAAEVEQVIRNAGKLALCRNSFVKARRLHDEVKASSAPPPAVLGPLKNAFPWLMVALFLLGLAVMTDASIRFQGMRLDVLFFVLAGALMVPVVLAVMRSRLPQ